MSWRRTGSYRQNRAPPRPRSLIRRLLDFALVITILFLLAVVSTRLDRVANLQLSGEATVNDGDSITLNGERIRLRGIDAPEYAQTCQRDGAPYSCGRLSRQALADMAKDRRMECKGWERDRYGRLLAICSAGGVDLNRKQVELGWAVAYGDYADVEAAAREKRVGLWAGSFDRPRDWRTQHGGMAEMEHDFVARIVNWLFAIFGFS